MKNWKTSTYVFIGLAVITFVLGTALFFNMPEQWASRLTPEALMNHHVEMGERNSALAHGRWGHGAHWGAKGKHLPLGILLIVGLVVFAGRKHRKAGEAHGESCARDILDQRFAAGEIQEDEYLEKKKILNDGEEI